MRARHVPKSGIIFVIFILTLASISISYSGFTDSIQISGRVTTHSDLNHLDLVGHWKLDDIEQVAEDSSIYGNNGFLMPEFAGPIWTDGVLNGALSFDGIDNYVDCGNDNALDFSTEDFSISVWVNIRGQWTGGTGSNENVCAILDKGTGHMVDGYGLHFSGNFMKIRFSTDGDDSGGEDTARFDLWNDDPLNYDQWYHVVAVRESGIKYLYVDGVQQSTTQNDARELSDTTRHLLFGKHDRDSDGWFNGIIDNVKIYSCALTPDEILDEYYS